MYKILWQDVYAIDDEKGFTEAGVGPEPSRSFLNWGPIMSRRDSICKGRGRSDKTIICFLGIVSDMQ